MASRDEHVDVRRNEGGPNPRGGHMFTVPEIMGAHNTTWDEHLRGNVVGPNAPVGGVVPTDTIGSRGQENG